jgi:GH15 family glucan-1,4-alpha-glucosidase
LVQRSIEIIEKEQSRSGAFPACSSFENYRYSWLRDSSFILYSLCRWGRFAAAKKALRWNAETIIKHRDKISLLRNKLRCGNIPELSDFLPARYHLDGSIVDDDWPAFQVDGYGAWLWAAAEYVRLSGDPHLLAQF